MFDLLFRLLELSSATVVNRVWPIIMRLPLNQAFVDRFRDFGAETDDVPAAVAVVLDDDDEDEDDAGATQASSSSSRMHPIEFFDTRSPFRLLYTIRVALSVVCEESAEWNSRFVSRGGFLAITDLMIRFDPSALSISSADVGGPATGDAHPPPIDVAAAAEAAVRRSVSLLISNALLALFVKFSYPVTESRLRVLLRAPPALVIPSLVAPIRVPGFASAR